MIRVRRLFRAAGGYGISVVISGIVSIAVIPTVIIVAGEGAWTTIAVSQAIAGFGFVLATYGWGVTGPTDVAGLQASARGRFFFDSLLSRAWLTLAVLAVSIPLAIALADGDPWLAALTVSSGVLVALSSGWFYVGERSPIRFLLYDTVPRLAGTAAGAAVLIATGEVRWFAGLQLLGVVAAAVICSADILRRHGGWAFTASPVRAAANLRGQAAPVTMAATTSLYVNVPVVIVQIFLPSATAVYALAERMVRLTLYATRPIVQVAQGYVPSPDPDRRIERARRVTGLALGLALIGGIGFALLAPWVSGLLSGGSLELSWALAAAMAANIGALLASQLTGFACLTALGLARVLARSTIVGAIVGTALMIPFTLWFGVVGLAWGLALSEFAVLAVQLAALRTAFAHPERVPKRTEEAAPVEGLDTPYEP